ncbi:AraC family ligand binding domain-containing protein [Streptomyces sp. NPDC051136]|uniref:AraC family ligand binding domain-containing protein n=1 Tax=Streptomyces sp. NPDC051136 TaxID=3365643 RepID=UPI0037B745C6
MTGHRPRASISAWRPKVPGISEVFHAHFTDHAYPAHTHGTWDLMILDDGAVDFALDRRRHGATGNCSHSDPRGARSRTARILCRVVGTDRYDARWGRTARRPGHRRERAGPRGVTERWAGAGSAGPAG